MDYKNNSTLNIILNSLFKKYQENVSDVRIIKESQDALLLQSSSVSALKKARFSCGGMAKIAGSYVEFAERKVLPEFKQLPKSEILPEHRREGFETQNADKIFESTYTEQTNKNNAKIG